MSDTVSWVVQLRIDIFFKEVWDFSVIGSILIWNKQKNYYNLTLFFGSLSWCQISWQNGLKHKSCPIPSHDRFCQILVDSCVIVNLIKVECDSPMYRYWGSFCGQHIPVWNSKWKWCSKISKGRWITETLPNLVHIQYFMIVKKNHSVNSMTD